MSRHKMGNLSSGSEDSNILFLLIEITSFAR